MERSMSSTDSRVGRCEEESNRPHKKPKYSPTKPEINRIIEDDADSSSFENKHMIPESEWWTVSRYLGKGSYGSVHLALSTEEDDNILPDEIVIKSTEISQASRLKKEESFLTRLDSPFVVSCYGHVITEEKMEKKRYYNTILEFCSGQCLAKHIKSKKGDGGLSVDDVKQFASDILVGLKYIHGEKIIHCDIKPKNILLMPENKRVRANGFTAMISGFGKAMEKGSIEYGDGWGHRRGTTRFMSPELIGDRVLDYGADVWAFGCTVLEMLTGERAWGEHGELDWDNWISLIGESGLHPYVPDSLSEEAKDFLEKCLERDPEQRWSVDSLLKHKFLSWNHHPEEEEEEEVEEDDDEIGDQDVEGYGEDEEVFDEEEEAIEIDEEYPEEESEEEV